MDRPLGDVATIVVRSGVIRKGDFIALQSLSLQKDGTWNASQLSAELRDIVQKYNNHFVGDAVQQNLRSLQGGDDADGE